MKARLTRLAYSLAALAALAAALGAGYSGAETSAGFATSTQTTAGASRHGKRLAA